MKANKTIRWKVTDKNRNSWISSAAKAAPPVENDSFTILKYERNKITEAPKDSMGCFCFKTEKLARTAIPICSENKLLKVQTYGKGKVPKGYIARDYPGTICYPAVMPLE